MEYKKNLSEPWFTLIMLGLKKVEGRLNKGDFKNMKKNDLIIWMNDDFGFHREFKTKIIKITKYDTFENYLIKEKLINTLPIIDTIENGLKVYNKYFPNMYIDEKTMGVLVLKLQLII